MRPSTPRSNLHIQPSASASYEPSRHRHQRLRAHRAHGVPRGGAATFRTSRSSASTTCSSRTTSPTCCSTTRCTAASRARSRVEGSTLIVNGKKIRLTAGEGPGRAQVGRSRRRRGGRIHRPLPRPRRPCEKHLDAGAKKVIMSAPSKDDTPMFVFGVNDKKYAGQAIISQRHLHHQLPRAAGQGAQRQVGHQARPDDHRARRHRHAEDRRRPVQQGLARRPRHPREHHPVVAPARPRRWAW